MNRIVISCGGTGGHLAPGIALAEGLISRGHACRLLISEKKVDRRLIENYPHLDFIAAAGNPFSLRPALLGLFLWHQARGIVQAARLIGGFSPDLVIGFGGFSTLGVALAAFVMRVPLVLHEANRVPGRAIRTLRGLAHRIYLPPGVLLGKVSPGIVRHYGCPVRREIRRISAEAARDALGLARDGKLLVVLGGSQGAEILNTWVRGHCEKLAEQGVHVYCVTGMDKGDTGVVRLRSRDGRPVSVHYVPFTDRISEVLCAADLVVSRAGAGTINELLRCRVPSILIPYPYAADNHQWENARFVEKQGGGIALGQDYVSDLYGVAVHTIGNDRLLRTFRENLDRMDREDCLERIMDDLERICGSAGRRDGGRVRAKGRGKRSLSGV